MTNAAVGCVGLEFEASAELEEEVTTVVRGGGEAWCRVVIVLRDFFEHPAMQNQMIQQQQSTRRLKPTEQIVSMNTPTFTATEEGDVYI